MGEKLVALWDLTTNSNVRSFDRLDVTEDDARMAAASMEPRNRPQPSHWTPVPSYGGQYGGRMPYSNNYPPGGYNHPLFVMASSPSGQYVAQQHSPHQMSSPVMILPRGSHLSGQSMSPRPQSPLVSSGGHGFLPSSPGYMPPHGPRM